jgi:tripartite-type tricarboxylate transporter receptor subunit TctC
VISAIKGGQVRALAVANATRLPALPDVPTAAEIGVNGYESSAWFGFVAPRGTPRPVRDRLAAEVAKAMSDASVRARFTEFGADPMATGPDEMGTFISTEVTKWKDIITKAGIKLEN